MAYNKKNLQRWASILIAAVSILFTCTDVPDFCRPNGQWFDPTCEFCFGGVAYPLCADGQYNPRTERCNPKDNTVGTMCLDSSVVAPGSPCGGYTLSVGKAPENGGTVMSIPNATNFADGDQVTLAATEAAGYAFVGWAGAVESTSRSITLTMDSNKPLIAMFSPQSAQGAASYTLVTATSPKNAGTMFVNNIALTSDASTTHSAGATVIVSVTPNAGYRFLGWAGGGGSSANPTVTTVTMNSGKTQVALFEPTEYTLTVQLTPEEGGVVYINNTAQAGSVKTETKVTAHAVPRGGFKFVGWNWYEMAGVTDVVSDPNDFSTIAFSVIGNGTTLIATFASTGVRPGQKYTLTTAVNPPGAGTVSPASGTYDAEDLVTVTASPANGYTFSNWGGTVNINDVHRNPLTITMNENKNLAAAFSQASIKYYCYWIDAMPPCGLIANPNAKHRDHPDMTEKEVCEEWGQIYQNDPVCTGHNTQIYYCDWGPIDTSKPEGQQGGCWRSTKPRTTCESDGGTYRAENDSYLPDRCNKDQNQSP